MPQSRRTRSPSDEELARRAQLGCESSFEELARRFQTPLLHFLRQRIGLAEADCEDLLQETLLRAYRHLHRYSPERPWAPWLFTIARHVSMNLARRRRPTAASEMIESLPSAMPPADELVASRDERRRLWDQAAETLSEPQHAAMWLYYVERMDVAQIAQTVGRSPGAVKTMMCRARKRLMALFQDMESPRLTSVPASPASVAADRSAAR